MTGKLIQIGNSKGLRIPKVMIEKYNLEDGIEVIESDEGILIKRASITVREGWQELIQKIGVTETEAVDVITNEFDREEWTW